MSCTEVVFCKGVRLCFATYGVYDLLGENNSRKTT